MQLGNRNPGFVIRESAQAFDVTIQHSTIAIFFLTA
jgi:hypothetical protein